MKVGKNKPLDEEEVEFLDEIESERRAAEAKRKREEDGELEAFKRAQRGEDRGGMTTTKGEGETATTSAPAAVVARKATVRGRAGETEGDDRERAGGDGRCERGARRSFGRLRFRFGRRVVVRRRDVVALNSPPLL